MTNRLRNVFQEILIKFNPRARLPLPLGYQLIRNDSITFVEIVKNSYGVDDNIVRI